MMNTQVQIIKFTIAGVLVVSADIGIYTALIKFLPLSLSKALSFTCAGALSYALNKYWIFNSNQASVAQIGRFVLINFLALGFNVATNQGVLMIWPDAIWPALATATALTSLLTFIMFKWWVFK